MGQTPPLTYALSQCGFSNRGRKGADYRIFISAIIFMGKTGSWWKNLPEEFGKYKSVHSRFTDWSKRGVFVKFFELVRQSDDPSVLRYLDTTFVKCSICATTGRCSETERIIGKTKGGLTTKVAAICDNEMRVHECRIDPGNDSDHLVGKRMELTGEGKKIVADKGFSSKEFRRHLEDFGFGHCIAQKSNEKTPEAFNKAHYKKRHLIENVFAKMGRWTRLELRRERLPSNFKGFLMIWAIGTWVEF